MSDSFEAFWKKTLEFWKALPIQERNFRKRIGLAPDKELSRIAFEAMPKEPLKQLANAKSAATGSERNENE